MLRLVWLVGGGGCLQQDETGEVLLISVAYVFSFRIIVEFILLQACTQRKAITLNK